MATRLHLYMQVFSFFTDVLVVEYNHQADNLRLVRKSDASAGMLDKGACAPHLREARCLHLPQAASDRHPRPLCMRVQARHVPSRGWSRPRSEARVRGRHAWPAACAARALCAGLPVSNPPDARVG